MQAVIGTRANINIAQIENYGGETFLSEELSIMILQDTKHAFERCTLVITLLIMTNNYNTLILKKDKCPLFYNLFN